MVAGEKFYPPAHRWLVGVELARYRAEAGMSMTRAAAASGVSKAKLGHLETGRQAIGVADVTALLTAYGADTRSVDRLAALTDRGEEAGWWKPKYAPVVAGWFSIYLGLERMADRLFVYQPSAVHGLLQTPAYARAITERSMLVRADRVDEFADLRLERAERLTDPERPLWLHAVLSLSALELGVGTPEVRRHQLERLLELAELPTITLQLLPPDAGVGMSTTSPRSNLLSSDAVSQVGFVELLDDAVYLTDPRQLRTYDVTGKELQRLALDPTRSIDAIREALQRFD